MSELGPAALIKEDKKNIENIARRILIKVTKRIRELDLDNPFLASNYNMSSSGKILSIKDNKNARSRKR